MSTTHSKPNDTTPNNAKPNQGTIAVPASVRLPLHIYATWREACPWSHWTDATTGKRMEKDRPAMWEIGAVVQGREFLIPSDAVRLEVATVEIMLKGGEAPGGYTLNELLHHSLKTIDEQIKETQAEAYKTIRELEAQRDKLLMLSWDGAGAGGEPDEASNSLIIDQGNTNTNTKDIDPEEFF